MAIRRQGARGAGLVRARPPFVRTAGGQRREWGSHDQRAAYARVAEAVGLSVEEVRRLWLDHKTKRVPERFGKPHSLAIQMLSDTEASVEKRIDLYVSYANARTGSRMPDGKPRFLRYHTHDSRLSNVGWPDDTILDRRTDTLYIAEAKRETYTCTKSQQLWLDALARVAERSHGAVVMLGVIRPSNVETLKQILI